MTDLPSSFSLPTSSVQTILPEPASNPRRQFLTPIPNSPGEFLLVLDNTSLDKIKRCHMAARNYLILGREPHAKNAALTFGGAVHEGLELFHRMQYMYQGAGETAGRITAHETVQMEALIAEQDRVVRQFFLDNPVASEFASTEYRTAAAAIEVLKHYRRRSDPLLHPDYEWEIQADDKGPIIERAFELPMGVLTFDDLWIKQTPEMNIGESIQRYNEQLDIKEVKVERIHLAWSGRIDLIAKDNCRIRIVDHKTSSIESDSFIQGFQISSQTIGYVWAARQMWPDLNVDGFCLNCIRFKKPTTGAASLISAGPRGGDPALKFFRSYFDYSPSRIEEWREDTILLIEDFLHSLSRNRFPLNDKQCFDKFGQCPYHCVCTLDDPRVRETYLRSDAFKQVTWNPVAGR